MNDDRWMKNVATHTVKYVKSKNIITDLEEDVCNTLCSYSSPLKF
jgi:hypothetical protein